MEVEAKFMVPSAVVLEELAALSAVGECRVLSRREVDQEDAYWDTPAGSLATLGASLRVRTLDGRATFTAKLPRQQSDGAWVRQEIEAPAEGRELPAWVESLRQAGSFPEGVRTETLRPVLRVRNRRTQVDLATPGGARLEMAADRAEFLGVSRTGGDWELELELAEAPGGAAAALVELEQAAAWLRDRFGLIPSRKSKYQRALAALETE
ncbi:MAG: CYTH domain-containing protein [Armatimonadetes bacterium]|nr:CYTH domain-containing protein [Armatimonadota bacterium]